jgi:hypothetical protein
MPNMFSLSKAQALLVTESTSAAVPVGSVFDVVTLPFGSQTVYSDLFGLGPDGQNLITFIRQTPRGNVDLSRRYQDLDAARGLDPNVTNPFVSYNSQEWLGLFQLL